ncbi:hypothetical protein [Kaarinaea lacus]
MKTNRFYIYSASANVWPLEDQQPELKAVVKDLWGKSYRRINHFIELALVGAKRCADQVSDSIPADTGVFLCSGQGNVERVAAVTEQIFRQHEAPMPFDFMNITNNMAGFYIAQGLGLHSSNMTVAHRQFPFEIALDLAALHMAQTNLPAKALVGAVDQCAFPLSHHRQRLGLEANTPLAEGSHWFLIGTHSSNAVAECCLNAFFSSKEALLKNCFNMDLDKDTVIAFGYGVDEQEATDICNAMQFSRRFDYLDDIAFHNTASAYAFAEFINQKPQQQLLHISADGKGRYSCWQIKAY